MNMFEEARAISGMINMRSLTQSEIAVIMGVSQSYIANKLRLLNFSEAIKSEILSAELSERHARALLRLKDDATVHTAIEKIRAMRLGVAASEALIDEMAVSEKANKITEHGTGECISRFETVIEDAVKCLLAQGIRAKRSIEFYGNKRYITVTIEENH